jgi:hypothetical protein
MSLKNYRRENEINFTLSRRAAKIMVIALKLQQEEKIDLHIEIKSGAIVLQEKYFVDGRNLYQICGGSIRRYPMKPGWAIGVKEIPFTVSQPSSSWTGGDRTELFSSREIGVLMVPEENTGTIEIRIHQAEEQILQGVFGKKALMGGWVE